MNSRFSLVHPDSCYELRSGWRCWWGFWWDDQTSNITSLQGFVRSDNVQRSSKCVSPHTVSSCIQWITLIWIFMLVSEQTCFAYRLSRLGKEGWFQDDITASPSVRFLTLCAFMLSMLSDGILMRTNVWKPTKLNTCSDVCGVLIGSRVWCSDWFTCVVKVFLINS